MDFQYSNGGPNPFGQVANAAKSARGERRDRRAEVHLENVRHANNLERDAYAAQHHLQNTIMAGQVQYTLNDQTHKHAQAETRLEHKNNLGIMDAYVGHVKDLGGGRPVGNASFPNGGSVSFESSKPKKKGKKKPKPQTAPTQSNQQHSPGRSLNPAQFSHAEGAYHPQGPHS